MDSSTAATPPFRLASRVTVTLLTMVALLTVILAPAPADAASDGQITATDEKAFLDLVNKERTDRGLAALRMSAGPREVARDWSHTMAAEDTLYHRPNLSGPFVGSWTRLGENVGVGWSVDSLHSAFMNSSGHRANVLNNDFRWVGVGVVTMSSGKVWVTFNFGAGDDTVADRFQSSSTPTTTTTETTLVESIDDFTDVLLTNTFADDVTWLVSSGITEGCTSDGTQFCPDRPVTRAQMAAFLVRALDLPDADRTFTDVPSSHELVDEIAALAAKGITEGCTADGTQFCPDDHVPRDQMAAFLHRALG